MKKKVIVRLQNFSKYYDDKVIIDNINLDIYEGEFLTLLGSSGCGKTTILRSIAGLDTPTKGSVFIDGIDVTDIEPPKREVNTIFQNYALFSLMSVYDNVAFGLRMKKVKESEIKTRVSEMLELVHLTGYENRLPKELSGGEQQRVSIIRGLINNPKVLLLDEPLSALDLKLRKKMQIELKQLQKQFGITFVYVTHDQDEALTMSDRIVVLNNHKIEQIGTPVEVYSNPKNYYVADFLGESNVFDCIIDKLNIKTTSLVTDKLEDILVNGTDFGKEGDKVKVIIRPEDVILSHDKTRYNSFEGIITDKIFDGSSTRIFIENEKRKISAFVLGNGEEYKLNGRVYYTWDMDEAIVLRD